MFRLRSVLEWKEHLERRALAERLELEGRAERISDAAAGMTRTRGEFPDRGTVEDAREWSRFGEGLRRKEDILQRRLDALRPSLHEAAEQHLTIRREVEGLRRLREREEAAAKQRRERKAQETMDDAANRRSLPGSGTKFPRSPVVTTTRDGVGRPEPRQEPGDSPNRGKGT